MKKEIIIGNETGIDFYIYAEQIKNLKRCHLHFFTKKPSKPPTGKIVLQTLLKKDQILKITIPYEYKITLPSSIELDCDRLTKENGDETIILHITN